MYTKQKMVIAGPYIEIYWYANPAPYGISRKIDPRTRVFREDNEAMFRSAQHAKKQVNLLVAANAWQWRDQYGNPCVPKFATFTIHDDIKNLPEANYMWGKFIKRFNYALGFKEGFAHYITAREPQMRGVWHYHALFVNLPYQDDLRAILENAWEYGYIKLKAVDHIKDLSDYLTKYMTKDMLSPRWKHKRRYFTSKGLLRPFAIRDESLIQEVLKMASPYPVIGKGSWQSEYAGRIDYLKFHIGTGKTINDLPLDSGAKEVLDRYQKHPLL